MTVYAHGFDFLSTATLLEYWDIKNSSPVLSAVAARDGTQGLRVQQTISDGSVQKVYFASGQNQLWAGISFKYQFSAGSPAVGSANIFMFTDSANNGQCSFGIDATGHLKAYIIDGATATVSSGSATSTLTLASGTWYSIQCRAKFPGGTTLDEMEIIVDDGTGPVTYVSCTGTFRWQSNTDLCGVRVGIGTGSTLYDFYYDNLYVSNEGFKGDQRVTTLYPNGAGSNSGWTTQVGGTGGTPYTVVNENPDNGDTSYLATGTLSALETLAMQDLAAAPLSITFAQVTACVRQETSATVQVAPAMYSGSTSLIGTFKSPGTSYKYYSVSSTIDPSTLAPWTFAGVNAVQGGAKAGPSGTGNVRLTQVVLEVQSPNPPAGGSSSGGAVAFASMD